MKSNYQNETYERLDFATAISSIARTCAFMWRAKTQIALGLMLGGAAALSYQLSNEATYQGQINLKSTTVMKSSRDQVVEEVEGLLSKPETLAIFISALRKGAPQIDNVLKTSAPSLDSLLQSMSARESIGFWFTKAPETGQFILKYRLHRTGAGQQIAAAAPRALNTLFREIGENTERTRLELRGQLSTNLVEAIQQFQEITEPLRSNWEKGSLGLRAQMLLLEQELRAKATAAGIADRPLNAERGSLEQFEQQKAENQFHLSDSSVLKLAALLRASDKLSESEFAKIQSKVAQLNLAFFEEAARASELAALDDQLRGTIADLTQKIVKVGVRQTSHLPQLEVAPETSAEELFDQKITQRTDTLKTIATYVVYLTIGGSLGALIAAFRDILRLPRPYKKPV